MATKKDLVEAYSFSRRRLVTAFVSGAPGGREVEPSRPGRTLVGGVALAVLVAAGGAVAGILGSHTSVDWTQPALVSDKDTGADYVILPSADPADTTGLTGTDTSTDSGTASEPVLRPVANITSAMLLLGAGLTHEVVSSSDIASQKRGAPIGILQAPATPPAVDSLVQTGWTACTGSSPTGSYGVKLSVSLNPGTTAVDPTTEMVFTAGGKTYVVAEAGGQLTQPRAYAYEVRAADATDNLLQDVAGVDRSQALAVPQSFIDLFPAGPDLKAGTFEIPQAGSKVSYADDLGASGGRSPRVGDYYRLADDDDLRVLLPDGVARLTPFAAAVYRDTHPEAKLLQGVTDDPARDAPTAPYPADLWPTQTADQAFTGQRCAVLDATAGQVPGITLATTTTGTPASADDVSQGAHTAVVDSGHGAVVDSGGFGMAGFADGAAQPYLIDDRGYAYPLDGDARTQLGYADVPNETVPDTWVTLFSYGVPLSVDAARCPPTSGRQVKTCGT